MRKIQELEAGHAHLKQEVSRLRRSSNANGENDNDKSSVNDTTSATITNNTTHYHHHHQRSHSVSPRRPRLGTVASRRKQLEPATVWKSSNSASFRHASPLQRESRGGENRGPSTINFTDRQYLNILQSMGQSVHIYDLKGQIIYW